MNLIRRFIYDGFEAELSQPVSISIIANPLGYWLETWECAPSQGLRFDFFLYQFMLANLAYSKKKIISKPSSILRCRD
jgi:hypothetical protein